MNLWLNKHGNTEFLTVLLIQLLYLFYRLIIKFSELNMIDLVNNKLQLAKLSHSCIRVGICIYRFSSMAKLHIMESGACGEFDELLLTCNYGILFLNYSKFQIGTSMYREMKLEEWKLFHFPCLVGREIQNTEKWISRDINLFVF